MTRKERKLYIKADQVLIASYQAYINLQSMVDYEQVKGIW